MSAAFQAGFEVAPGPDRFPHSGRTSPERRASSPFAPTASSILPLLSGIERYADGVSAAAAFQSALRRKGIEANTIGGLAALNALTDAVPEEDPSWADARLAILQAARFKLLPGSSGRPTP